MSYEDFKKKVYSYLIKYKKEYLGIVERVFHHMEWNTTAYSLNHIVTKSFLLCYMQA